jgi:hypothetical protein
MLAVAGSIFGLFLLCSLYLQNVLGMGPLATGLAFIPLAVSAGIGAARLRSRDREARRARPAGRSIGNRGDRNDPSLPASARAAATSVTFFPAC